jgi:hypothetical protein
MTPLVEVTPGSLEGDNASTAGQGLSKVAEEVLCNWGDSKLFVDLGLIPPEVRTPDGTHPVTALFDAGSNLFPSFIPVTALDRNHAYQEAVGSAIARDGLGLCLRLQHFELWRPGLANEIHSLLGRLGLEYGDVHLLVDCGIVDDDSPSFSEICDLLPFLSRWRTFMVAGGAFPKNLVGIRPPGQHLLPRREWLNWRDQVTARPPLPRLPSFGDYVIQHPTLRSHPATAYPTLVRASATPLRRTGSL